MEENETSTEAERSYPLLEAIVEFREALDRLIGEQKELVRGLGAEPTAAEFPAPPVAFVASPPPAVVAAPVAEPEPHPARKQTPSAPRTWPRENPAPVAPAPAPVGPEPSPAANPEDARQRLDALAAKLLDRRLKQTAPDPAARQGEGSP